MRTVKHSLTASLLASLLFCGAGSWQSVSAAPQPSKTIIVPSGERLKLIQLVSSKTPAGTTINLGYITNKPVADRDGIAKEADNLWDLMVFDAERAGAVSVVISVFPPVAVTPAQTAAPAAAPSAAQPVVSFVLKKDSTGNWVCKDNKIICGGSPAKVAYHEAYKNFTQGKLKEALQSYDKCIALDPTYAQAYADASGICLLLNQPQEALAKANKALSISPENANALCNRGVVSMAQKDYQLALDDFNNALRINPNMAVAYEKRGTLRLRTSDYERAVADLTTSIRLNPNAPLALHNRAIALEKLAGNDRQKAFALGFRDAAAPAVAAGKNAVTH